VVMEDIVVMALASDLAWLRQGGDGKGRGTYISSPVPPPAQLTPPTSPLTNAIVLITPLTPT
jgi:hypothetical protein